MDAHTNKDPQNQVNAPLGGPAVHKMPKRCDPCPVGFYAVICMTPLTEDILRRLLLAKLFPPPFFWDGLPYWERGQVEEWLDLFGTSDPEVPLPPGVLFRRRIGPCDITRRWWDSIDDAILPVIEAFFNYGEKLGFYLERGGVDT